MVYEIKCSECGDILDFGGEDPDEHLGPEEKMPEDAIKFNGDIFCRECVQDFVKFGVGDIRNRVDYLENKVEEIMEALDMEKNLR